jgi:hypothetical protein
MRTHGLWILKLKSHENIPAGYRHLFTTVSFCVPLSCSKSTTASIVRNKRLKRSNGPSDVRQLLSIYAVKPWPRNVSFAAVQIPMRISGSSAGRRWCYRRGPHTAAECTQGSCKLRIDSSIRLRVYWSILAAGLRSTPRRSTRGARKSEKMG